MAVDGKRSPAASVEQGFFFIVGCPRSGTTLLQRMLGAHPKIVMLPEQRYIPRRLKDRENLTSDGLMTPRFVIDALERGLLRERGLLHPGNDTLLGTQAPERIRSIPSLGRLWPQGRFIHIVRDGRDVCLSLLEWKRSEKLAERFATWQRDPISTIALWWEWNVRLGREAGSALGPGRYYELRYESLVESPEIECARICGFLGLTYEHAMVRFHEGRERPDGNDAKHGWLPPTAGLRDWRTEMSEDDVERFEAVAGEPLDELGYPRAAEDVAAERLEHAASMRSLFEGHPLPRRWGATGPPAVVET